MFTGRLGTGLAARNRFKNSTRCSISCFSLFGFTLAYFFARLGTSENSNELYNNGAVKHTSDHQISPDYNKIKLLC